MQLVREIRFTGETDLNLAVDQEFIAFAVQCGYGIDVDYILVSADSSQYETGVGQLGVGGIFSRSKQRSSTAGTSKMAFDQGRHLLVLSERTETVAYKASDQTGIGTSFADVTDTGLAVAANTSYDFEFNLICDADATTTGIDVSCNGPAGFTNIQYLQTYWTSATVIAFARAANYDVSTAAATSSGTAQAIYSVRGTFINGANAGTLIARVKREAVGSANVRAGSFGRALRTHG